MRRLLIPERISLNEAFEEKDKQRIIDLFTRGKGSDEKVIQLAQNMANSIDDYNKALRRAEAAEEVLGPTKNPLADIFYARAAELQGGITGKPVTTDVIKQIPPVEAAPKENPKFDMSTLPEVSGGRNRWRGNYKGVMFLPTYSAMAIYDWEITGQLSDGAWENSKPDEHWVFWNNLEVRFGVPEVQATGSPVKTGYNLASLIEYVKDRMIALGKFGKAVGPELLKLGDIRSIVEEIPIDKLIFFDEWKAEQQQEKSWLKDEKMWAGLSQEIIDRYRNTVYTEKDLRKDLGLIKQAMHNVNVHY